MNIFSEVMINYIDGFSTETHLWETCNFRGTRVILKGFAVYLGLDKKQLVVAVSKFVK